MKLAALLIEIRRPSRTVPAPGSAAATASLSGEVQVGFASLITVRPHLSSGRLRALAITARERSSAVPELPTVAEFRVFLKSHSARPTLWGLPSSSQMPIACQESGHPL